MNPFFPFAVAGSVVLATLLIKAAGTAQTPFAAVEATMLSSLVVLAILEHLVLVVPLPLEKLWIWRQGPGAAVPDPDQDPSPTLDRDQFALDRPGLAKTITTT